jgi:hypothetical protein
MTITPSTFTLHQMHRSYSDVTKGHCQFGIRLAELAAPMADRLGGHDHATDGRPLLGNPATEAEPLVQPHAMADDLGREAVVLMSLALDRRCRMG